MSDEVIIEYCSPTLAGIKTGNLFTCGYVDKQNLMNDIRRVNKCLVKKGIRAIPVRYSDHRVLVYVYRPSFLVKDFCDRDTAKLLSDFGYKADDAIAFGCPAMGAEVLEETEFDPMFSSVEGLLNGKKTGIFGSYGWGDGQWMRDWKDRCDAAGAALVNDGVMANNAPDEDAVEACKNLGAALA